MIKKIISVVSILFLMLLTLTGCNLNLLKREITIKVKEEMEVGRTYRIRYELKNISDSVDLTWKISDPEIAKLDEEKLKIKALKEGTFTLSVEAENGIEASTQIKVVKRNSNKTYSITYDLAGGTWNGEEGITEFTDADFVSLPTPVKEGYDFVGWYQDGELIEVVSNQNYKLTAKWEVAPTKYTITYNLVGGYWTTTPNKTEFSEGEVVELPIPVKEGSEFLGWYTTADYNESSKINYGALAVEEDIVLYAKWEDQVYHIEYDLDGGTLEGLVERYTINDVIVLGKPEKTGYTFKGWVSVTLGNEPVLDVTISNSTGNIKYYAVYEVNQYVITFDANGGQGTQNIYVDYEKNVRLEDFGEIKYPGMKLIGWNTDADGSGRIYKVNQEITYTSTENLTLYAMWKSLITLDAGKNAKYEGDIPAVIEGQAVYKLPVPVSEDNVFFLGWYVGEQQITNENGFGLVRWSFDEEVTLKAKWSDTMIKDGVTYYYRGVYPQTRVTDDKIIAALSKKTTTDARGYYEYNGSYYAKVKFDGATDVVYFNDGTRVLYGNTYYFKVEKVLWRVLDEKTNVAITEYVLDALPFYDNSQDRYYEDYKVGITARVYPNDFYESNLHKFLNDGKVNRYSLKDELKEVDYETKGFLTSLFGLPSNVTTSVTIGMTSKYIKYQMAVDNTEESTLVPGNEYSTYYTDGYFFPLSHKEYKQTYASALKGTKAYATDYAIAKEIQCYRTSDGLSQATWWLRSPYYDSSKEALFVDVNGLVAHSLVTNAKIGLRPACVLILD